MNGIVVGNSFVITRAERDAQVVSKIYRHVASLKEFKITQEKRDPEMRKECVSIYGRMWEGAGDLHCTRGMRVMSDPVAEAGEKWGIYVNCTKRCRKQVNNRA
jgi:hypothetical protein